MRPITCWLRYDEDRGVFKHNHIEFGHIPAVVPAAVSDEQKKSWASAKWAKTFAYLDEENVVVQKVEHPIEMNQGNSND